MYEDLVRPGGLWQTGFTLKYGKWVHASERNQDPPEQHSYFDYLVLYYLMVYCLYKGMNMNWKLQLRNMVTIGMVLHCYEILSIKMI
jgi:hypothetical protein